MPNPAIPKALPTADVSQFSMYDVLLIKVLFSFYYNDILLFKEMAVLKEYKKRIVDEILEKS